MLEIKLCEYIHVEFLDFRLRALARILNRLVNQFLALVLYLLSALRVKHAFLQDFFS